MRLLFTTIFLSLSTSLFAQYQIRPAQLTDHNDHVLAGYVKYYDWGSNPERIEFGLDSSADLQPLALRNIRKLAITNGPSFESLYLKVPYYAKDPIKLGEPIIQSTDSTYYLSEILLESEPVKLYRFLDKDQKLRFVVLKYDSLTVLEDIRIRVIRREMTYDYQDPLFRKTLRTILYECPTLNTANTLYTESSLIELLKQYLSFCRIDSKIYLEQKKIDKIRVGIGGFGSYWKSGEDINLAYGLNLQLLFPRQFHNVFALLNVGSIQQQSSTIPKSTDLFIGLYAGRYFGRRAVQGKIYTGLSTLGILDTGLGLSYRKIVSVDVRYPLFGNVLNNLRDNTFEVKPLFHLSAMIPINR